MMENDDVAALHSMGYAQQLSRRLGVFSNFAISFSIICILAGGITSYPLAHYDRRRIQRYYWMACWRSVCLGRGLLVRTD